MSCLITHPDLPFCFFLLIVFPLQWPVFSFSHTSCSHWVSLPSTGCSLRLVCFSLVFFHGSNLFFRSQLKNTLLDIPHLIIPHRILTMAPDLLPSEHCSTLVIQLFICPSLLSQYTKIKLLEGKRPHWHHRLYPYHLAYHLELFLLAILVLFFE